MSTLYREYRPQNFFEVFGQNHIKITLEHEIEADQPSQAYLFCGPRAVGKTTMARIFAKAINCENRKKGEYEPCNKCNSCLSITTGNNLDILEIDAASNTGVDNVRDNIIAFSRLAPNKAKYKVFIIDEVHMLSLSAFNALLKIIEEPPKHVIFILCTTEVHKVPNTIVSRCERFDFKKISNVDIIKKLSQIAKKEKIEIDKEVLEVIAYQSGGHLRDAESILGQIFSLGEKKISLEQAELVLPHHNNNEALDLIELLARKDAVKAVSLVNDLVDRGVDINNFVNDILVLLRKIMLNKLDSSLSESLGLNLGEALEIKINNLSSSLSWSSVLIYLDKFTNIIGKLNQSNISQLPLEMLIVELCYLENEVKIEKTRNSEEKVKQEEKKEVIKEEKKVEGKMINVKEKEVLDKWPEFLVKIKKYNHSLSFVLQNCQPHEIKNNEMCLTFKYKFHEERIKNEEIKQIVEKSLAEVFGASIQIQAEVDENLKLKEEEVKEENEKKEEKKSLGVNDILQTFGGEIIT